MLSSFGTFPRIVNVEDDLDDLFSNVWDSVLPYYMTSPSTVLCDSYPRVLRASKKKKNRHLISINVGKCFEKKDISTTIEGNKLKISGHSTEDLKNGSNVHQFERFYDIPEDVDQASMKTELCDGYFHVLFNKTVVEPKKEIEYLSTDDEFRVRVNFDGFNPEEMSVKTHGQDVIIEATKKYSTVSECGETRSTMAGYASRTLRLPDCVHAENLRASLTCEGLEIFAPKDQSKIKPDERTLEIENKK